MTTKRLRNLYMMAAWLLVVLSIMMAGSCGESDTPVASDSQPHSATPPPVTLSVKAPEQVRAGDRATLRGSIKNPFESAVEITGALSDEGFQFYITDPAGREVWRFLPYVPWGFARWTLAPMQEIAYEASWRTQDNDFQTVEPGEYFIKGRIFLSDGQPAESAPVKITVLP